MLTESLDVGRFILLAGGLAALVRVAVSTGWVVRTRLRRCIGWAACGLLFASFTAWVYPTPWKETTEGQEIVRTNVVTGERQVLLECGCHWLAEPRPQP
jgi:hypothetical protein